MPTVFAEAIDCDMLFSVGTTFLIRVEREGGWRASRVDYVVTPAAVGRGSLRAPWSRMVILFTRAPTL